jgi:hypothetical protein
MDRALQALDPSQVGTGWALRGDAGFYIHRNRLYLQGQIYTDGSAPPGTTLLTGLTAPAGGATSVTLYCDPSYVHDVATPGITVPISMTATITTGGELVLDSLPPYADTAPGAPYQHVEYHSGWATYADFDVFSYTLVLGDVSWMIGSALPDSPTWQPLGTYIGGDFTDIDSEYAVSDARVMVRGHVRASVDGPFQMNVFSGFPADAGTGLNASKDSWARATGPGGAVILDLQGSGRAFVGAMEDIDQRPAQSSFNPGAYTSAFGEMFAGLRNLAATRMTSAVENPNLSGSPWPVSHAVAITGKVDWNYGTYTCGSTACPMPGPGGSFTLHVADLLAAFYPEPDWFMLIASGNWLGLSGSNTFANVATNGCSGSSCGPNYYDGNLTLATDASAVFFSNQAGAGYSLGAYAVSPMGWTTGAADWTFKDPWGHGSGDQFTSMYAICRARGGIPAASEYAGDASNPNDVLLWRPGEINTLTFSMGGHSNNGHLEMTLALVPFYSYAEHGLRAGDILTLDGAGWQAAYTTPPPVVIPPSTIAAGEVRGGIVPLHRGVL